MVTTDPRAAEAGRTAHSGVEFGFVPTSTMGPWPFHRGALAVLALATAAMVVGGVWGVHGLTDGLPAAHLSVDPGDGTVALQWTACRESEDACERFGKRIGKWQYQQRLENGERGPFGGWTDLDGSGADATMHQVDGLRNGWTYVFRVRAVEDGGRAGPASNEERATPAAGRGLVVRQEADGPHVFRVFHLRNAVLAGDAEGEGIRIEGDQRRRLEALRNALAACATGNEGPSVEVRGFASSAPFMDGEVVAEDSNALNLRAANARAASVADVLEAGESRLKVQRRVWASFDEMEEARSFRDLDESDGRVPDREYLNRSVEIRVADMDGCAVASAVDGGRQSAP